MSFREEFVENGYIVKRSLLNEHEVIELQENVDRFIKKVIPNVPNEEVYYDDVDRPETLKQIQHLSKYDRYFKELALNSKVLGLAEECLGAPVDLINVQYFNKSPEKNLCTPPHQDGFYFPIQPQEALTMWLSLDDADVENGAVRYIPKSHNRGLREHHRSQILGFSQSIKDWSEEDEESLLQMEAKAGDILVHHSLTIHASKPNVSTRVRRAVGFIFYRSDVVCDEKAHALYQKNLAKGLALEGKL